MCVCVCVCVIVFIDIIKCYKLIYKNNYVWFFFDILDLPLEVSLGLISQ